MKTAPKPATIYRLGLLSDLHCMSRYGLVPPKFWPQGGAAAQPAQQFYAYMWSCWLDFVERCPSLDACIINGDVLEGETPTSRSSMDALTDNFVTQGDAAEEVIGLLRPKIGKLWVLRGTRFHEGKHVETLESVARNVQAEQWSDHRYTGEVLDGEFHGLQLNATHHMTTGWIYPAGGADRTALFAAACEAEAKAVPADVIVRSHLHMRRIVQAHGKWVVLTPAWKLINPHAIKVMEYYRAQVSSDLGAIILETDGQGSIAWRKFEYAPYKPEVKTLG